MNEKMNGVKKTREDWHREGRKEERKEGRKKGRKEGKKMKDGWKE